VNRSTQFWNASGISVSGGLAGLQIKSDSLQSLIEGGIAFDTPDKQSKRVGNGYGFSLFADEASATEKGSLIELEVASGEGLHSGTPLRFKGLEVGKVQSVALNSQRTGVLLKVRVFDAADLITRQGSQFWVVRPELGILRSANLDTLVSGPYLQVLPAANTAPSLSRFTALSSAPDVQEHLNGLQLVLTTSQRHSLKPGIPITYRGMVVGQISYLTLSKQAEQVLVHILIEPRYATLVHSGSQFWNSSGINVGYSLLKGVKVRTDSIESIVEGGIAFATPDDASQGAAALQGQRFALNDESKAEWLKWQPRFNLGK
jgi:paraquat-inducible protein B